MLHNHIKNRWSPAKATTASLTLGLLFIWGLSTLTAAGPQTIHSVTPQIIESTATDSATELQPAPETSQASSTEQQNWSSIIEDIESTLGKNPENAIRKAQETLRLNPPAFFYEQLKEIVEKGSKPPVKKE